MPGKRTLLYLIFGLLLPAIAVGDWRDTHASILLAVRKLNPPLGAYDLSLDTISGGGLALEGWVASPADRERIEQVARSVVGAVAIRNEIKVDLSRLNTHGTLKSDTTRAAALTEAIGRELLGSPHKISVLIQGDRVILRGSVETESFRVRAVSLARRLEKGEVSDEIELVAPRADSEIAAAVVKELRQQYPALARNVSLLNTREGVVTLVGDLKDHEEVDLVLSLVMMVEGVRDVSSEITVQGQHYNTETSIR